MLRSCRRLDLFSLWTISTVQRDHDFRISVERDAGNFSSGAENFDEIPDATRGKFRSTASSVVSNRRIASTSVLLLLDVVVELRESLDSHIVKFVRLNVGVAFERPAGWCRRILFRRPPYRSPPAVSSSAPVLSLAPLTDGRTELSPQPYVADGVRVFRVFQTSSNAMPADAPSTSFV